MHRCKDKKSMEPGDINFIDITGDLIPSTTRMARSIPSFASGVINCL